MSDPSAVITAVGGVLIALGGGVKWLWSLIQKRAADLEVQVHACHTERALEKQQAAQEKLQAQVDAQAAEEKNRKETKELLIRISALEAAVGTDFPKITRNSDGVVEIANPEFVQTIGAPRGYIRQSDFVGKKLQEMNKFLPEFLDVLKEMDAELHKGRRYSVRANVELSENSMVTVIKRTEMRQGELRYISIIVPQR